MRMTLPIISCCRKSRCSGRARLRQRGAALSDDCDAVVVGPPVNMRRLKVRCHNFVSMPCGSGRLGCGGGAGGGGGGGGATTVSVREGGESKLTVAPRSSERVARNAGCVAAHKMRSRLSWWPVRR